MDILEAIVAIEVDLKSPEISRVLRNMSSWSKVSDVLYSSTCGINDVLRMLKIELLTKKRPYIINRIYGRYVTLTTASDKLKLAAAFNTGEL